MSTRHRCDLATIGMSSIKYMEKIKHRSSVTQPENQSSHHQQDAEIHLRSTLFSPFYRHSESDIAHGRNR
jgi:hypothetical protein